MDLAHLPAIHRVLQREYKTQKAPVVEFIQEQTRDPFKVLVTTLLSSRTRDGTTTEASRKLFAKTNTAEDLRRLSQPQIERLIFPVGFYRMKARHLKQLPDVLDREFGGRIPDTVEALCTLPGVGRKTANLVVAVAFDKPAICVDVHVHRITNRLGLVCTRTPLETERTLRRVLPVRYWKSWNRHLVAYGQTVCTPRHPRCARCPIRRYCDQVGVG